jgi:hypothetical protein
LCCEEREGLNINWVTYIRVGCVEGEVWNLNCVKVGCVEGEGWNENRITGIRLGCV